MKFFGNMNSMSVFSPVVAFVLAAGTARAIRTEIEGCAGLDKPEMISCKKALAVHHLVLNSSILKMSQI